MNSSIPFPRVESREVDKLEKIMSRYPYTEAYDALRSKTEWKDGQGITFSRSEAAQVVKFIAEAIGMDNEDLACKIADHARKIEVPYEFNLPR